VADVLSVCLRERAWLVSLVRELVRTESPSTDRNALKSCAIRLGGKIAEAGGVVKRIASPTTSDHLLATWPGSGPPVLLIGHYDTVWPVGQIARMPLVEREGKLFGPGVYDMKAGLAMGILAARALVEAIPVAKRPRVSLLITSDEETGSLTSRALIEQTAREHVAVLVLEPALPDGAIKTARKGVGEFEVVATGVSAHAGVDPSKGASAVHEIARQIAAITALADPARGLTVNVGVVEGGSRPNVIAEHASARVDVRIARLADGPAIEAAVKGLKAVDERVQLQITGGINRPPMERTEAGAKLFALARDVAREMGEPDLREASTGGGSDGNFTSAIGVPTIDGLGAVGDGAHALHEHVIVESLPRRAAIVAGLVRRITEAGV
jgi:glutamate carboxypeptidase